MKKIEVQKTTPLSAFNTDRPDILAIDVTHRMRVNLNNALGRHTRSGNLSPPLRSMRFE
jgi:hypothetical protein